MTEKKIDAILLTTEPNFRYFSGFLTQFWQSPTRPWFLIIPRDENPIAVIPEIGLAGMESTWIKNIRTWTSPCPEDDGISLLTKSIKDIKKQFGRIGVTLGRESHIRMPISNFKKLIENISPVEIEDFAIEMHWLKRIKSSAEIRKIQHICEITSTAFEGLPDLLKTGDTERDCCLKLRYNILKLGADNSPYMIAGSGLGGYDNIIMGPTDKVLEIGDVLIIDTGSTFDGYYCDFDRNFAFGELSDKTKFAYDVVFKATDAGFKKARPGNTTSDIWRAMWETLENGGALGNTVGRLGHGLGMELTEWPSITSEDNTLLESGMILTLEPGMTFSSGKQMVHEENIVITDDEPIMLSKRAPETIPIIK